MFWLNDTSLLNFMSGILRLKSFLTLCFLLLFNAKAYAESDCSLFTKAEKQTLINESQYPVDEIICKDSTLHWYISNKRFMVQEYKRLPASKKLERMESVFAGRKKSRKIASIKEKNKQKKLVKINSTQKPTVHSLSLSLFSGIASISSTDQLSGVKEKSVSEQGYGFGMIWNHHWTQDLKFFVAGSIKSYEFKASANRTLNNPSETQAYIGTGLTVNLGERLSISPEIGLGESIILTSLGGSELAIDKVTIESVSLSTNFKIIKFGSHFSLGLNLRTGKFLSTTQNDYNIEDGQYYHGALSSRYDLGGSSVFINAVYTKRNIQLGNADQDSHELGVSFGIGWGF